ncbi:MAG TPA: dockerin type I domain-containing protein [Gemmataceae bacterium]|nr:dockerin type I domain-containing protein [Gemmataceae bacterium]
MLAGNPANGMFRLFGDVNGDATVNGLDLAAFRTAFGTVQGSLAYLALLDANGDSAINGLDLTAFLAQHRKRGRPDRSPAILATAAR